MDVKRGWNSKEVVGPWLDLLGLCERLACSYMRGNSVCRSRTRSHVDLYCCTLYVPHSSQTPYPEYSVIFLGISLMLRPTTVRFFSRHSVLSSLLIHVLVIPLCTDQLALIYYYYLACNMYASTIWLMLSAQILPKWCIPATISTEYTNVRKGAVAEARLHAFGLTRDRVLKEGTLASTDLPRISGTM